MDSAPISKLDKPLESSLNKNEEVISTPEVVTVAPATPESLQSELSTTNSEIQAQEVVISGTTDKVNEIRHNLGLEGEITDIPSVDLNKKKVEELEKRKTELEAKLKDILQSDLSPKYADAIEKVRKSKIDWAHSEELARRLKLKGATEEDVGIVRNWLVSNATGAKTFVLPPDKYEEAVSVLHEMTGQGNVLEAAAFHVGGGIGDVPEEVKSSVILSETPPKPPIAGREAGSASLDMNRLHHEFGHVTQDGLLESELYSNWKPKTTEGASDPEYVGLIHETDTRIRSMFRDLNGVFEPGKERFGRKQLEILKEKYEKKQLSPDTLDLFKNYDVLEIVKMANRMPAI